MNPEKQLDYEVLFYIVDWERDTEGPGGDAPFIYPDVLSEIPCLSLTNNQNAQASFRRLSSKVSELQKRGYLKPTAHPVAEIFSQQLTSNGYDYLASLQGELDRAKYPIRNSLKRFVSAVFSKVYENFVGWIATGLGLLALSWWLGGLEILTNWRQ